MSTLSRAPRGAGPEGAGTASQAGPAPGGLAVRIAAPLLVALAFDVVAFLTTGGEDLAPNVWVEIALILLGASAGGLVLLRGRVTGERVTGERVTGERVRGGGGARGRGARGGVVLGLFAALAALTAASVAWSVTPDLSWVEAGRTLSYLAAFGCALAASRLVPERWETLLGGLALAAVVICGWAVLVKTLDLPADGQPEIGRLLAPFGYWNATGLAASIGLPPLVWCAARRVGSLPLRGLAISGLTLLIVVDVFSYSRSAVLGAILGLAVLFWLSESRLRSALVLGVAGAVAAAVCAWALSDAGLTRGGAVHAIRESTGRSFAFVLAGGLLVAGVAGWWAIRQDDRTAIAPATRHRIGAVILGLLALVPVGVVVRLAVSSRGFTGEVSHIVSTLTSTHAQLSGRSPSRLVAVASARPAYWREGISVATHHLLLGAGAGSFGIAHLRYATALLSPIAVGHAHSYIVETFADLGIVGLVLSGLLLVAWLGAARRPLRRVGAGARSAPAEAAPPSVIAERDGMVALAAVVVAFGVSSTLDWTWFFPGVAIPTLVAAGWLAGRGMLGDGGVPVGPGEAPRPAGSETASAGRRSLLDRPGAILGLTGLLAATLVAAYLVWQPLRSQQADAAANAAASAGRGGAALAEAQAAVHDDPVSLVAREQLAAIDTASGRPGAALAELRSAVRVQPENPQAWSQLGQDELADHEPRRALRDLRRVGELDVGHVTTPNLPALLMQAETESHSR